MVSYKPDLNYCGPDSFDYTLNGGSTATVAVTVACAPEDSPARDQDPPETTIADGPSGKVKTARRRAKVTFELESDEAGSTFLCRIDGGEYKPCGETKSYKLKPGRHVFRVVAVDAAGNVDETPVKQRFKIVRVERG